MVAGDCGEEGDMGGDCLGTGFPFGAMKHSGTRYGNGTILSLLLMLLNTYF